LGWRAFVIASATLFVMGALLTLMKNWEVAPGWALLAAACLVAFALAVWVLLALSHLPFGGWARLRDFVFGGQMHVYVYDRGIGKVTADGGQGCLWDSVVGVLYSCEEKEISDVPVTWRTYTLELQKTAAIWSWSASAASANW